MRPSLTRLGLLGLLPLAVIAACSQGEIGGDTDGDTTHVSQPQCVGVEPGGSPIRRMTRTEYNNTVRDLLGDTTHPADSFVAEEEALGFNNQASALGVTQVLADQLMKATESLAVAATAADKLPLLLGCDANALNQDACAKSFIDKFGARAWRRPLTADEKSSLFDLYAWGRDTYGFGDGVEVVVESLLQSAHFLYRVEMGMPNPVEKDVVPLGSYEVASRLSYLFWNSMPDEELFHAAELGKLGDTAELAKQAHRMLADPKARQAVENFHYQWLGLKHVETLSKDKTIYPKYDDALRPLWIDETQSFLDEVVFDGAGDVTTLLTAPYTMMNKPLADFYGVTGPTGDAFVKVPLDGKKRGGLLTQASLLAVNAKINQSSPIHRGKFVRERLLCQQLPPPPNNVKIVAPEVKPGQSTRDRFSQHTKDPVCKSCHTLMDPIGFGFEHFDGIGEYRETDQGLPVDATGEITGSRDADGKFDGPVELEQLLANSDQVRQCVATQWFRFGYGRAEQEADQCSMDKVQEAFKASGYNIQELLVALTQTDAFRYRHKAGGTK